MTDLIEPLMVPPGSTVRLSRDHDPGCTGPIPRQQATGLLADGVDLLAEYHDQLAAQDTYGVLLVLPGLDASGKDSAVRHVMSGVNPLAVEVRAFKQPSAGELDHDFSGGTSALCPGGAGSASSTAPPTKRSSSSGCIRSCWPRNGCPAPGGNLGAALREINGCERCLADNGIHIVKVMLIVSGREQAKRFLKRIDRACRSQMVQPPRNRGDSGTGAARDRPQVPRRRSRGAPADDAGEDRARGGTGYRAGRSSVAPLTSASAIASLRGPLS